MSRGRKKSFRFCAQTFLNKVQPTLALVSASQFNSYGLPRKTIARRYIDYFTTKGVADADEHEFTAYLNDTDYEIVKTKKPFWVTYTLGDSKIKYS